MFLFLAALVVQNVVLNRFFLMCAMNNSQCNVNMASI